MTALVLYVSDRYLDTEKKKDIIAAALSALCDGLHLNAEDVTVVLEAFQDGEANERVHHCFFPVLYVPEGTPYADKKRTGELMNERLKALMDPKNIDHVYLHMKEHGVDHVAVNGVLLKYDTKALKRLDEARGVNSTPWLD